MSFEDKIDKIRKEMLEKANKIEFKIPKKLTEEDIARIKKDNKKYEDEVRESEKSVYRSMRLK